MAHSQTGAEHRGVARKRYVEVTSKIIAEYLGGWLGATAAMREMIDAKRALDRQLPPTKRQEEVRR